MLHRSDVRSAMDPPCVPRSWVGVALRMWLVVRAWRLRKGLRHSCEARGRETVHFHEWTATCNVDVVGHPTREQAGSP